MSIATLLCCWQCTLRSNRSELTLSPYLPCVQFLAVGVASRGRAWRGPYRHRMDSHVNGLALRGSPSQLHCSTLASTCLRGPQGSEIDPEAAASPAISFGFISPALPVRLSLRVPRRQKSQPSGVLHSFRTRFTRFRYPQNSPFP